MLKQILMLVVCMCFTAFAGEVRVTSVTAQQRYPWNGLVDVAVTLQGTATDIAKTEWSFAATNNTTKAALPVRHVTQNGADTGSGTTWTRKFIWDTNADLGEVKINDVALTVDVEVDYGGVQLWEGGPYWAECNVGATKPEECGYYFWWGDTVGYRRNVADNGWVSVKDGSSFSFDPDNCPTYGKNNATLQSQGYIDATGNLVVKYDAATAHLGAPWRMPMKTEVTALVNNCDTTWTTRNGVCGYLVRGRGTYSSKSIFLPVAGEAFCDILNWPVSYGYYWSSTPYSDSDGNSWSIVFLSGLFHQTCWGRRFAGETVRPVRGSSK